MSSTPAEAAVPNVSASVSRRVPLLMPAAGWLAGLLLARTDLIAIPEAMMLAGIGLLLGLWRRPRAFALAMAAALAWGAASLLWDAHRLVVDPSWTAGPQAVTADIAEIRTYPSHRLLLLTHVRRSDGARLAASVQAALYGKGPELAPGMRIAATGIWHAPRNAGNPGAFDYRAYCFDHDIAMVGSLRGEVRVLADHASWLQRLRRRVTDALSPLPGAGQGVLRALLLGDRSRMPVSMQDDFAATGTAHLLSISGLHVGMVATWAFFIAWWLLTRREAWIVALPVRRLALAAGVLGAFAYASLAGWPLPTERAALMLAAAAAAWMLRRHVTPMNTMLAALMLILALAPAAVDSVSLWLSFAATAGILAMLDRHGGRRGASAWMLGMFAVTVVAALATLPVVVAVFGRLPAYTVPSNLVAVPLYTGLILPLALIGEVLALIGAGAWATGCFHLAAMAIDACGRMLAVMHAWPWGNLWVPRPPDAAALFYAAGMGLCLWLWLGGRRKSGAGLMTAVLLAWGAWVIPERPPAQAEWVVWDVGQGAASSLTTPTGRVLVMDVPGPEGALHNGGSKLAAGLRTMGLAHVDVLALSHAQADHMGGAARLAAQERRIGALWLADVPANHAQPSLARLAARIEARGGRVRWLARGDRLAFGAWHVRVLWPPRGLAPGNPNNASLVLSVGRGDAPQLLWPGDVEAYAERAMLAGGIGGYWAMLMPHHGSRTSSTPDFVAAVHPAVAIAQTGAYNRFGFPDPKVVRRYIAVGARVWNTANGAVTVRWRRDGRTSVRQFQPPAPGRRARALQWWQGAL